MRRTAIVTGGGSSIGRGLALGLADRGISVTVADIDFEAAQKVVEEIKAKGSNGLAIKANVGDTEENHSIFKKHLEHFGRLDYVIVNAGVSDSYTRDFIHSDHDQWTQITNVNIQATLQSFRYVAEILEIQPRHEVCTSIYAGPPSPEKVAILLMGSLSGHFPMEWNPVYSASKAASLSLATTMSRRLRMHGIRVCSILPVLVETPLLQRIKDHPIIWKEIQRRLPVSVITIDDVVKGSMELLLSEDTNGVSAVVLKGGRLIRLWNGWFLYYPRYAMRQHLYKIGAILALFFRLLPVIALGLALYWRWPQRSLAYGKSFFS